MQGKDAEATFHELAEAEAAIPEAAADLAPEDWISVILFWILAGVIFLQFVTRYVLNDSLAWTEEIARYLLMVLCFTGSAMAARRGGHIAVEIFIDMLPVPVRRYAFVVVDMLTVAFFAVMCWLCFQVAEVMQYQPMVVIDVPLSVVYGAILIGLLLTTFRFAMFGLRRFRA